MTNEDEVRAYQLLLKPAIGSDIKIKVTDKEVLIESDNLSAQKLEQLLANPERFRGAVEEYVAVPVASATSDGNDAASHKFELHGLASRAKMPASPHDFLRALFDEEILTELGDWYNTNSSSSTNLSVVEGNIMYKIKNYSATKKVWDGRISMLRDVLQSAGISGIEEAFSSGTPLHLSKGQTSESDIAENIDDLVGIKVDEDTGEAIFYLQQMNMAFTPEIAVDTESNAISVNKEQLANYFGRVFGKIAFPKQELRSDNDGTSLVTPVIIPQVVNAINQQNAYFFLIDISSSLANANIVDEYKAQLIEIIRKLVDTIKDSSDGYVNPQDFIRLVFFSDNFQVLNFPVTEAVDNIQGLIDAIMAVEVRGETLLDGALAAQLDDIQRLFSEGTCNVKILVFTDGVDTKSSPEQKKALQLHGQRFINQEARVIPEVEIVRVGNANASKIDALSKTIADAKVHTIGVSELSDLFARIKYINSPRELIQFLQEERKTVISSRKGILTVGPDLDPSKSVEIAGQMYNLEQAPGQIVDENKALTDTSAQFSASAPSEVKSLTWWQNEQAILNSKLHQRVNQSTVAPTENVKRKSTLKRTFSG